MNVGYTPERGRDLASRLQRTSAALDAASVVVECARRVAAHAGERERAQLIEALLEYEHSCPPVPDRRINDRLRRPAVAGAPRRRALRARNELRQAQPA